MVAIISWRQGPAVACVCDQRSGAALFVLLVFSFRLQIPETRVRGASMHIIMTLHVENHKIVLANPGPAAAAVGSFDMGNDQFDAVVHFDQTTAVQPLVGDPDYEAAACI
jgi:hypothetical protein